jgi:AraC-like DNA-binding protein
VDLWRATFDRKLDRVVHSVAPGFGHGVLGPVVANVFQVLRVSASLWEHGQEWFSIHVEPSVTAFELQHAMESERYSYNERNFSEAQKLGKPVRAEYGGFLDIYVPILKGRRNAAMMVVGPVAARRPTSADVLERWRWLTGRQGHPADPEFASYLSATLSTLVLEGEALSRFEELLQCLALLMAGEGRADVIANRAGTLRAEIEQARFVDRMWEAVRNMIDDRTSRTRYTEAHGAGLRRLGFTRRADTVLVGLTVSRAPGDLVDAAILRDAFQREVVHAARSMGNVLAGQVGDHGVVLLAGMGSGAAGRRKLLGFAEQMTKRAEGQFGFSLHFGLSPVSEAADLSRCFQVALGAAESALSQGVKLVVAESSSGRPRRSAGHLRRELARAVEERPELLAAKFDIYLEAVATQCGYRVDAARGYLEAGFERIAEPLVGVGALDPRGFATLTEALDRAAGEARSVRDLFAAYRRAVRDIADAVERPVAARRDRSLRSAIDFIHQHYTEPLRLESVARSAGFTASHFSKLFIRREKIPFERYVRRLRLERAKQLLVTTTLDSTRIAELSGFGSVFYFSRVFRAELGVTPLEYRRRPRGARSLRVKKVKGNS